MFDGRCAYCGTELTAGWHADHIEPIYRKMKSVPVKDGFPWQQKLVKTGECYAPENDHIGNFMPSCRPCNIDKNVLSLEDWRASLERKPQVLRDNYSAWRHAERFGLVAQVSSKVVFYFERTGGHPMTPEDRAAQVNRRGISVQCVRCQRTKAPHGRSVADAMYGTLCNGECPGYREDPQAGCLWPGETAEEFGFHSCEHATEVIA